MPPFVPHGYQRASAEALVWDPSHALLQDPGLGKSATTLLALLELDMWPVLVTAPLRVCTGMWPAEVAKWDQFRGLRVSYLGDKKADPQPDIWTCNPARVGQIAGLMQGKRRPRVLVCDEIHDFKTGTAQRSREMQRLRPAFERCIGLTGSPADNGLLDLHGQMLLLDQGEALGKFVTHYRREYFNEEVIRTRTGSFSRFTLQHGASPKIWAKINPRVTALQAKDWLTLPDLITIQSRVELPKATRAAIESLKDEAAAELASGDVLLGSSLARMRQLSNGVVYVGDPLDPSTKGDHEIVHTAKLDRLSELLAEIQSPTMIAYEFRCEREEIAKRLKRDDLRGGIIGGGISARASSAAIEAWNAKTLDFLLVHPAAAGTGLNLQAGGRHLIWFGPPFNLTHRRQLNARLHRQGQRETVLCYDICSTEYDTNASKALADKLCTHEDLMEALR